MEAWRTIKQVLVDQTISHITDYTVSGKRFFAFDWDSGNNELVGTIELKDDGEMRNERIEYRYETLNHRYYGLQGSYSYYPVFKTDDLSLTGTARWCVCCNEEELWAVSGGTIGSYFRRFKVDGIKGPSNDPDNPAGFDVTYTYEPNEIFTERSWVKDVDLRTKSLIAEKRRITRIPNEPVMDNITGSTTLSDMTNYYTLRFLGDDSITDYSQSVVDSEVESSETWDLGTRAGLDLRSLFWHGQLMPNFYQLLDGYEFSHLQTIFSQGVGADQIIVYRFWFLFMTENPLVLTKGNLQSRFGDVLLCTSDEITRQTITELNEIIVHRQPTYSIVAKLNGSLRPVVPVLITELKQVNHVEGFNISNITTI
jgi:hypothetical protein